MYKSFLILFSLLAFTSCNKFNKVLTSTDATYKEAMANKYLKDGDCDKSALLFDDLLKLYRGTTKAEKIYYKLATSHFCEGEYLLAAHYFNTFQRNYSRSEKREEAMYMIGRCYQEMSPEADLDQGYTDKSIQFYDYYLNKYPNGTYKEETKTRIAELKDKKLDKQARITLFYLKTENFKPSIRAINLFLQDYPDSKYEEEMKFSLVDANYKLAYNSVEEKKKARYKNVIIAYQDFKSSFPNSKHLETADKIKAKVLDWQKNN